MEELLKALLAAGTISLVVNRTVEFFAAPIKLAVLKKHPDYDFWWLLYPSWIIGAGLAFAAGINLFLTLLPTLPPVVGLVMSAIVIGGGANLIHDIFDKPATSTLTATSTRAGTTITASASTPAEKPTLPGWPPPKPR